MDEIAKQYVQLVLSMGSHDADYVDAYYGPEAWRAEVLAAPRTLVQLKHDALATLEALRRQPARADEISELRHQYLARQLQAVASRVDLLSGVKMTFDEESQALYDAVAPTHDEAYFETLLVELQALLPGSGPVCDRFEAFRSGFYIPPDRLDAVYGAAISACRRLTQDHVELPQGESFVVEYVKDKSWSAYNWYKGGFHSLIQVNVSLPIAIDRAVDLAAHEGYPGHHVYNALLEQHLVRERGFQEFTVYPLFSPQSLIAEGTANFGIEVAFPGEARVRFERDVLFPLAGLDTGRAEAYARVRRLAERLGYAGNEAARRYLEGRIDADAAAQWLESYALMSPDRARQRVRFFDQYRSYVINYNLGQDLVRSYIESRGGTPANPQRLWDEFMRLLASPRLPGGLR